MAGLNLMDMLTSSVGQGALEQIAKQFGLSESQVRSAVKALLPAISGGLKRNVAQEGGLVSLLGALQDGGHEQYLDQPETLENAETVTDGNAILGHLFGSEEVTDQVAKAAGERAGLSSDTMKQMLPIVASIVMGALSKQTKDADLQSSLGNVLGGVLGGKSSGGLGGMLGGMLGGGKTSKSGDLTGMLGNLLDADGDGNATDDIFDMVMKRR